MHLGSFTPAEPGDYLVAFDPEARGGRGEALFSPDISEAMRFVDGMAAMTAWKMQSRTRPLRPDGKPNRPLTAYTVEAIEVGR
jgi:hypothetical protein